MDNIKHTIHKFSKSHVFKHGLPFLIVVVGGSLFLKQFASLRFEYSNKGKISKEDQQEIEELFGKPLSLETAYKQYIEEIDVSKWENKRIQRPWEE